MNRRSSRIPISGRSGAHGGKGGGSRNRGVAPRRHANRRRNNVKSGILAQLTGPKPGRLLGARCK